MSDPLANPDVVVIPLTDDQVMMVKEKLSGSFFAVIAVGNYPDNPGRFCVFALPVDKETANAACLVALGKKTAPCARYDGPHPKENL